jgi:hypothetical protein
MPIDLRIEQFNPETHDRSSFSCGVKRLDNYLKLTARKHQKHNMTRVYVVVADGDNVILGYHAINLGMMNVEELSAQPRGAPDHGELPILFLGQVAVCISVQNQGLGSILMHHVFEKACVIADQAGCFALVLDVMSDGGSQAFERRKSWYADFGFQPFASNSARMFMTMTQVRAVVQERLRF